MKIGIKIRIIFALVVMLLGPASMAMAAGLIIPASSFWNVNSATFNAPGNITNAGTLLVTTGAIGVTGDWTNSATFTSGNGTVNLTGGLGVTQALISGGIGAGKKFFHLTHSGAGTVQVSTNALDIDGAFTNSAGIFNANGLAMTVAGNWSNSATFTANNNAVTLDGSGQSMIGSTTFYNLTKTVGAADTLTFDNTATQTITHALTLSGFSSGQKLFLRSDAAAAYNLTLQAGGTQSLSYLDVQYSDASGGITLVGGTSSTNSGNNTLWAFSGTTLTWNGATSTNWDIATNWDLGYVPGSGDSVVIANVASAPLLATNQTITNLTINASASLNLNGKDLIVQGSLVNNGTLNVNTGTATISGNLTNSSTLSMTTGTISLAGNWSNSSTFTSGTGTVAFTAGIGLTQTLTSGGIGVGKKFYHLSHTGAGTVQLVTNALDIDGNITNSAGTFDANGIAMTLAGNWSNSATFTANSNTLTLDGTSQSLTGSTTFYNLTKTVTAADTLTFDHTATFTISNVLTLQGASGQLLSLRSSSTGNSYDINDAGTEVVSFVDVKDSIAANSIGAINSTNSLGNTHWTFTTLGITTDDGKIVEPTPTIIGVAGPSDTVVIKDGSNNTVATTTADANGNFRVEISTLPVGANTLTPYVNGVAGDDVTVTVTATPTTSQVPVITAPTSTTIRSATPTITGHGKPGSTVTLTAKDANGNLPLTNVATATVAGDGTYTISSSDYTTPLVKGTVMVSVTVDGVVSDAQQLVFIDPFGVIFDSVSNNPIQGAVITCYKSTGALCVPGVDIDGSNANPQTTGADGVYSFLAINGNYYFTVSATGYTYPSTLSSFPAGRTIVTGSKGETFTVAGAIIEMDHPMDGSGGTIKATKTVNKKQVVVGDIVTYTVTLQNQASSSLTQVYVEDIIPAGFKYVQGRAIVDNVAIADPAGQRPLTFNIGTIAGGATKTLKYQLVVGSGVSFGTYENKAWAKYSDGTVISNTTTASVKLVPDALFDMGTVIGKVFWDLNEDGIQNGGEETTIPHVSIVSENGLVITSDQNGLFHVPELLPGRHVLRLDESTLPEGTFITTQKAVVIDVTEGSMTKVNFGVSRLVDSPSHEEKKPNLQILREREKPNPRLHAAIFSQDKRYELKIMTNYFLFIDTWKWEIIDKENKKVVKTFEGDRLNINNVVLWTPQEGEAELFKIDHSYSVVLTVTGRDGHKDTTKEIDLPALSEKTAKELEKDKKQWMKDALQINDLQSQTIPIEGETIKILPLTVGATPASPAGGPAVAQGQGQALPLQDAASPIKIFKSGQIAGEISLTAPAGQSASDVMASVQNNASAPAMGATEMILPNGEYTIDSQPVKVGEDYLFFVAMGDEKLGYSFNPSDVEGVARNDKYQDGFWSEGKMSYYLKGKIKGKYLITSSLDTQRNQTDLFKNLDPDQYYPVYGDGSSIDKRAADTQGPLYLLIQWDKSSATWGNYSTGFNDTTLATFNRTLYGGQVHYESVASTQYGDPKTKLVVFRARAQQKAAHNELLGTGGSLYYLKNKDVIEGTEHVRVEVRDETTGLVLGTTLMQSGVDYQIDYSEGRIIFWKPISQIAAAENLISSSLLDGNPLYVVTDYEYATLDKFDQGTEGLRLAQSLTDFVKVGGTYVKEGQIDKNYELKGTDVTLHAGAKTTLSAEYAESISEQMGSFISTDGGLSYTQLSTGLEDRGKAIGLKAQSLLWENVLLSGYYRRVERGFSSASTTSDQGKELLGWNAIWSLSPQTQFKASHDIQKLINDGNLQTQLQVGAQETQTTLLQVIHTMDRLTLTGEVRHQEVKEKSEQFISETNTEEDTAAVKGEYALTKKVTVSLEQQVTLKGEPNHQTTAGIETKLNDQVTLRAKETVGNQGTATTVGGSVNVNKRFDVNADLTRATFTSGQISDSASVGGRAKVDENNSVYSTVSKTTSADSDQNQSVTFGTERKVNDELSVTTGKTFAQGRDALTQSSSLGVKKEKNGRLLQGTLTEQQSVGSQEDSGSNIFGLSGDINDNWAAQGSYEKGEVQNHDGTRTNRNAGSFGIGFVDKDKTTLETILKASSKLEFRFDEGQNDKQQYLIYNSIEGKVNPETTLFAKANVSKTRNTTAGVTEAQFKELSTGFAYRPLTWDRLNFIGKYSYVENDGPVGQTDTSDIDEERAHVIAGEVIYDLNDQWQVSEKVALKQGEEKVSGFDFTRSQTWLVIERLNYKIDKSWKLGVEYRILAQAQARDQKQGAMIELTRQVGEFVQIGLGYNFTTFNDDLTHLNYTSQGPFVRLTGTLYDRTAEEAERDRQKQMDDLVDKQAWELLNKELAKPDSPLMKEMCRQYQKAQEFEARGEKDQAKEWYQKTLQTGQYMYIQAQEYVRSRVDLEYNIKRDYAIAEEYHRQGHLLKAKKIWKEVLKDAEIKPITFYK